MSCAWLAGLGGGSLASSNSGGVVLISDTVASGRVISTQSNKEPVPAQLIGDSQPRDKVLCLQGCETQTTHCSCSGTKSKMGSGTKSKMGWGTKSKMGWGSKHMVHSEKGNKKT